MVAFVLLVAVNTIRQFNIKGIKVAQSVEMFLICSLNCIRRLAFGLIQMCQALKEKPVLCFNNQDVFC